MLNQILNKNVKIDFSKIFTKYSAINIVLNQDKSIEALYPSELNTLLNHNRNLSDILPVNIYENYFSKVFPIIEQTEKSYEFVVPVVENSFYNDYVVKITPLKRGKNSAKIFNIEIKEQSVFEDNYKHIFESAIFGIYQFDVVNNKFLIVNPELARILGFESVAELHNGNDILQYLNINHPSRRKILEKLKKSKSIYGLETRLNVNGKKLWISENLKAIINNGEIVQIIGTIKDISENNILIERLQAAKDDWQRTFDAIEEVIIILDKELKIVRLNKAALKEYNTFTDNPEGVFCTNLYRIGESHCNTCPARATILDLKPHKKEVEYTSLGKTFLTSSLPIFDDKKEFIGVVFIAKNITEKKKLKIESEKRLQQVILADRLKSLGEMVANVAHEINNPNNFVVQNISLLEKSWKLFNPIVDDYILKNSENEYDKNYYSDLSEEMSELIDSIKIGSKRINDVVSNLKGFAKSDIDKFESVSINEVINSSLKIIQSKINKSFKDYSLQLSDNLPNINADTRKLEQVFVNLVVNSIQARNSKIKTQLRIRSKYIERLKAVYVEVIDNGHGISNQIIPKLFNPFFTTRRDEGGTGLGLSISSEIIKKHKGIIDAHSIIGQGTIFKIYLPAENQKLELLNSRMLCVDNDESIFKSEIVCFLGEGKQTMRRLSKSQKLRNYLSAHPEIDIIIINAKLVSNLEKLIAQLLTDNFLFEIIIFNSDKINYSNNKQQNVNLVNTVDEKEIIIEINKLLNTLSR